jgi:hypothetical protein
LPISNVFCKTGKGGGKKPDCKLGARTRADDASKEHAYILSAGSGMNAHMQKYTLSKKAAALKNSKEWQTLKKAAPGRTDDELDDLLTSMDGLRAGSYVAIGKLVRTKSNNVGYAGRGAKLASDVNRLIKKYGLTGKAFDIKGGVAVIREENLKHPDVKKFLSSAGKTTWVDRPGIYAAMYSGEKITSSEKRLLGKWLGYDPKRTEKYVAGG